MGRKSNKSNFGTENYEKTFNCHEIAHTKEAEVYDIFQRGLESDTILHSLNVEVLLRIDPPVRTLGAF